MTTITHSHSAPPAHPSVVLRDLVAELEQAGYGLAIQLAPIVVDQPECAFCDPTRPSGVIIATIAHTNRFDRLIRRPVCSGCMHDAVAWATSEGRDVTVRAAITAVIS